MPRVAINNRKYKESEFGKFVKGMCVRKGIKIQDVADELNTSRTTFWRMLRDGNPRYGELLQIVDILGLSDEEVVNLMRLNERTK